MSRNFELLQSVRSPESQRGHQLPEIQQPSLAPTRSLQTLAPAGAGEQPDWLRAWLIVRKNWRLSALFAAVVIASTVLFTLLSKPVYEPTARLEVDPPGAELFSMDNARGGSTDAEYIETQAKNLQSDELAVDVIRQLRLDNSPELTGESKLGKLLGRVLHGSKTKEDGASSGKALQLTSKESRALASFRSRLGVKRDTASRIVNVTFSSHDPELAAVVDNTLVHAFVERTYQTRHDAIMQSTQWLSRQLDDIRDRMEQSNRALADFQSLTGIADVDQNRSTFGEEMAELSRQKMQAEGERINAQSYLQKIHAGNIDTLPQVQSNVVIQQLVQKQAETKADLSQTLAVYGTNHPTTKKLQNRLSELQAQIELQQKAIVGQIETNFTAAAARTRMIDGQMKGTSKELSRMSQYSTLKKDAEANAQLYNSLYARVKETGIAAASKSSNIRIVDQARVLDVPTRPRPLINFGAGLLIALVGGVLFAFVREGFDTRIHTVEDVRRCTGMSSISILPYMELTSTEGVAHRFGALLPRQQQRWEVTPKFLTELPNSVQAEALRSLHTTVMLSQPKSTPQVLLVVSSLPAEGKTTVAVNLAIALAQQGPTCLLDTDLRRPGIGRAFRLRVSEGLGEHLADGVPLDRILVEAPAVPNLSLLPACVHHDPAKVVSSAQMRQLLQTLRERFAFVVIDSPPILPYAEGRVLSPLADGVILVGRAGVVTRDAMMRSLELLEQVHAAPILDIVLNSAEFDSDRSYRYYRDYHD